MKKNAFQKISTQSNKYIISCFNVAIYLLKNKKISGLIKAKKRNFF